MGLKVWLPLNGNLENKGCDSLTLANTGASINTSGKIGSCYSFNGSSNYMRAQYPASNYVQNMSFCCWVKLNNITANMTLISSRKSTGYGMAVFILAGKIRFDNGNDSTKSQASFSTSLTANTWQHICVVSNAANRQLYINGILKETISATAPTSNTAQYLIIGGSSGSDSIPSGNWLNGYLNDVRIYNHCLSATEVHEISQGLVLHYKLDGGMNGNENLILASHKVTNSSSASGITRTYMDDDSLKVVAASGNGNWCSIGFEKNSNSNVGTKLAVGDTYTISCDVKVENGTTLPTIFINSGNSYKRLQGTIIQNSWIRAYYTSTWADPGTGYGNISLHLGFSGLVGTYYFKNFKLEKSSSPTIWSPAPADGGVDLTQIQDSSGYGHNGTILGNPIISSDTARYTSSASFPADADGILSTYPLKLWNNAFTYSFWIKPSGENGGRSVYAASYSGTSCSIEKTTGNKLRFYWNGSPDLSTSSLTITDGIWQHIAIVKEENKTTVKCYYNGVLKDTFTNTFSDKTFSGDLRIARDTRGNATSYTGMMSDFRIYCTALSAADVKQLYEIGAKVDNKGNLHAYEFNENGSNKLKKTGIFYNYAVEPYMQLPDGSCWKLMLFHYVDGGRNLFTSSNATYNDGFGLYSRLRDINNFKYNNKYEFYVLQDDKEFRWTQTSQPTASSISGLTTVSGYTNPVNGLAKASQSNTYIGYSSWWGACGCWTSFSTGGKTGIPGFGSHDGNGICTIYLALYIRIDTITYRNASNSHYANNLIEL